MLCKNIMKLFRFLDVPLFHSDRWTKYCSKKFRNALRSQKMFQSMSRKGNCWDNACAEIFSEVSKLSGFMMLKI
jgi:transposase InsO family protein